MFETWSLKKKLLGGFFVASAFLAGVGGFSLYHLRNLDATYSTILENNVPNLISIADLRNSTNRSAIALAKMSGSNLSAEELKQLEKEQALGIETYEKATGAYLSIPFLEGEEKLWNEVVAAKKDLVLRAGNSYALARKGQNKERDEEIAEYFKELDNFRSAISKLSEFQERVADEKNKLATSSAEQAIVMTMVAVILGICASIILGIMLAKSISEALVQVTKTLSNGANEVASAATQISSTSEELSSAATEQAAALQETAASVEEMSAMIKKSADNSSNARELSDSSANAAQRGKATVEEMIGAINEIDASNKDIAEVVKVIADIGSKTKVINDIVFKTQLLSFNASVEAARAGEHGKGFAVVAEEVGNLAQMSGTAANQISSLLDESLSKVERLISNNKSKVDSGLTVSKRCGEVLDEIVRNIADVNSLSGEVETASQEQSRGVNEITKAMTQLDQVTQQNAAASQQAASASEQLAGQANVLQHSVVVLESVIHGTGTSSASHGAVAKAPKKSKKSLKDSMTVVPPTQSAKRQSTPAGDDPGFGEAA